MGDMSCLVNERYRKIINKWHDEKYTVQTYEYTDILPRGDVWYLPLAQLLRKDLQYYSAIGNVGWCDEVAPFDGIFTNKSRVTTERWIGNALDIYLTAQLLWNINADYNVLEEEAGSLYYGKAWKAIKMYRHLLAKSYESLNDHFVYGSKHWQLGRVLEERGVQEQLEKYLKEAADAAKGDTRVEKIVAREQEFFQLQFVKSHELFAKSFRENEIRANEYHPDDATSWKYSDWAYAGTLALQFQYGDGKLYLKHGGAGKGAKLKVVTPKWEKAFKVEISGVLTLDLGRTATGESCDLGLILEQNNAQHGWNGDILTAPGIYRKVVFGHNPILKNANFATFDVKDGQKTPRHFGVKSLQLISDGTAASGKNFLRGNGLVFQHLYGLRGHYQTYSDIPAYQNKLRIRAKVRGTGSAIIRLSTSKLAQIGQKTAPVNSPGKWQEITAEFDCAENTDNLLLLYVILTGGELDLDDIQIEKLK